MRFRILYIEWMFKLQEMKLAIKDEMTVEGFKNFGVENKSTE